DRARRARAPAHHPRPAVRPDRCPSWRRPEDRGGRPVVFARPAVLPGAPPRPPGPPPARPRRAEGDGGADPDGAAGCALGGGDVRGPHEPHPARSPRVRRAAADLLAVRAERPLPEGRGRALALGALAGDEVEHQARPAEIGSPLAGGRARVVELADPADLLRY